MKLSWRQSSEATRLLRLAKSMQALRKPISEFPNLCTKLVMEINHIIERYELSRKDRFAFSAFSQAFDRKLFDISRLKTRLEVVAFKGVSIQDQIALIEVPASDVEGIGLKSEVLEGCLLLAETLDQVRDKLDRVEDQLKKIYEELRTEVR